MRHAKAEPFASTDHERALTDRGRRDAAVLGSYLSQRGVVPDHAIVSTAERTRATWSEVEAELGSGAEVTYDGAVYSGSTDVLLEVLRTMPETAEVVVLVGHQPSVGHLAHLLDDGAGDHDALRGMLHGFPASSAALFDVEVAWERIDAGAGRLTDFHAGKG